MTVHDGHQRGCVRSNMGAEERTSQKWEHTKHEQLRSANNTGVIVSHA